MPGWQGSNRRAQLPPDWGAIRKRVLKRDGYRCRATNTYGERCAEVAVDVDHKHDPLDHSDDALQSLCEWHHDRKSGAEGARARAANRRRHNNRFRRTESHPGLL